MLRSHQPLAQRRQLDIEVEIPEVEVRRECLGRAGRVGATQREGARLALRSDALEIQQAGKLFSLSCANRAVSTVEGADGSTF